MSYSTDCTDQFERSFARHVAADHAVAFGFARHALVAALTTAGLKRGDEVILSPLTCKVVPLALLSMELKPVYVDISPDTLNIDPAEAQDRITTATRAIVFQHTYGHPGGVEDIASLARQTSLFMVEDCAQCMPLCNGTYRPGQHGDVAIFSNNAGKPLSAGSGGMAVTNNVMLAGGIREVRGRMPHRKLAGDLLVSVETWLRRHLLRPSLYWLLFDLHRRMDGNYSQRPLDAEIMDEITKTALQPSLRQVRRGLRAMHDVTIISHHRTACCADYRAALDSIGHSGIPFETGISPLYYYPILVNHKAALLQRARQAHIEIIPWPVKTPIYPVEDMAALEAYGYRPGDCPVAEKVAARLVGLPTHNRVTPAVCRQIVAFLASQDRQS